MSDDSSSYTKRKNRQGVKTHHIGRWTIEESLEPFRQPKNLSDQFDVHQWNIDQVCSFVEQVLSDNQYKSIIEEHLIDGFALVLLKEEHLTKVFQMPLIQRHRLLDHIKQIQI